MTLLRFLGARCVFMQSDNETQMDVAVRVLGMPLEEVYARRHAIQKLASRLNERATAQIAAWAMEAVGFQSERDTET
jgi:hypothetical protein